MQSVSFIFELVTQDVGQRQTRPSSKIQSSLFLYSSCPESLSCEHLRASRESRLAVDVLTKECQSSGRAHLWALNDSVPGNEDISNVIFNARLTSNLHSDQPNIQDVPGRKVNIPGGHNIGHSKQKMYMYMCPIQNGFRDTAISLHSSKIVDKKYITYCF
jgi:hypothetical protein